MSMFKVSCKCGHVGKKNYIKIDFPVVAETKKAAAEKARKFPRVKHHHKDAILDVVEIDENEYEELLIINSMDDYLKCKNIQEQNLINLSNRLINDPHYISQEKYSLNQVTNKIVMYKKNKVRKPKRFFKNQFYEEYNTEALVW